MMTGGGNVFTTGVLVFDGVPVDTCGVTLGFPVLSYGFVGVAVGFRS